MASKNDNVMLTLGIVVLMIAIIGSAVFEGESSSGESSAFRVSFSMESEVALNQDGHTNEGQTTEIVLDLTEDDYLNITSIDFQLSWNDDLQSPIGGANDEFELTITHPENLEEEPTYSPSASESSSNEQIDISAGLQEVPENVEAETGSSEEEISNKYITKVGYGSWKIEVSCNSAGDRDPTPLGQDNGNDWTLTVTVHYYTATVSVYEIAKK